ncbi:unnamed protein product [Hymenolepis diminuta]|uniref:Nuclear receptor domain-containing protein n=1 Tax=Hymenolepis diminuta TaxID=6216 RepID=A0A0R3ST35_HYMDI|nr:unnamed protein product [Hymenolepis diminuta]
MYELKCNGLCLIEVNTRNRCQYCGFQKCLNVGMQKDTVGRSRPCILLFKPSKNKIFPTSSDITPPSVEAFMTSQSPPTDLLSSLKRTENLLRKSISNSCILENYINWARNMPSIDAPNVSLRRFDFF